MKIVAVSDTHGSHRHLTVPDGDVLVFTGDATRTGELDMLADFNAWLGSLPHKHKVMIAGNHDFCFQDDPEAARAIITNAIYLEDEAVTIEGVKFYGSPFTPFFYDWAFQRHRGEPMREKWQEIPADTDVLLVHGPPHQVLDFTVHGVHAGCEELALRIAEVRPKLTIFGHIHEAYGTLEKDGLTYANASVVDLKYMVRNETLVLLL